MIAGLQDVSAALKRPQSSTEATKRTVEPGLKGKELRDAESKMP